MKLIGMLFIVVSAGSVGIGMAVSLKKNVQLMRQMLRILQILRNEIAFCGTPLPQAFALAAASCDGVLSMLFADTAKKMDRNPWMTAAEAMKQVEFSQQNSQLLSICVELAEGLGQYDLNSQLCAVSSAKERTEALLNYAEQERSVKSKLYETLGICAGLSMAILLI